MTNTFFPWRLPLACGATLTIGGFATAYLSVMDYARLPVWLSLAVIAVGILVFRSGLRRWRGVWVEGRASDALRRRLPSSWSCEADVATPYGNCDVVVMDADKYRYAIEIKSKSAVVLQRRWFRPDLLQYVKGDPAPHLAQAADNAVHLGALPVLWFPTVSDDRGGTIVVAHGAHRIIVVAGNAKRVVKAMKRY